MTKGAGQKSRLRKALDRALFKPVTMHPGTEAQPFFWPAFRMTRKRALRRIKRSVGKAIREAK